MKLYSSPTSPFVRKCRIVAMEHGVALTLVRTNILGEPSSQPNPLLMIPSLEMDDGQLVVDSRVICHVLSGGGPRSLQDRVLEAVADGLCDRAMARMLAERSGEASADRQARRVAAIRGTLDHLNMQPRGAGFGIGEAALVSALSYLDLRHSDLAWRDGRDALAGWMADHADRPSVASTEYQP